jgi:hypothetical protein
MRLIRSHLTFANVASAIALFIALSGGTAIALSGANTVFSDDIVDGEVKSPDLAKLGFTAVKPNPVGSSDPCVSGQVGVFCGNNSGSGLRGFENLGRGYAAVAYARDGLGIVHLRGTMYQQCCPAAQSNQGFILPSGYRPPATQEFVVAYGQSNTCGGGSCDYRHTVVQVKSNGDVIPLFGQPGTGQIFSEGVSLDGVEFKAK